MLKDRVEEYVGSITDATALANWLTVAANQVIDLAPINKLQRLATQNTVSASGADITKMRVLGANKGGYKSIEINPNDKTKASDSNSIYLAVSDDPKHYFEDGKVYILPSGGSVLGITYPTLSSSSASITNFPEDLTEAVVILTSIQAATKLADEAIAGMSSLSMSTETPPTAPTAPTFVYTDAVLGSYASTTIGDLGTAPTYTKPTVSGELTIPNALSLTPVAPSTPSVPSFTYTDATLGSYASTVVGSLGAAPTYTKPTMPTLSTIPDALTLSAVAPTPPSAPTFTYTDAVLGSFAATAVGSLGTPPAYTKVTSPSISYTNTETRLTNDDIELAQGEINKVRAQLEEFQMNMYNELNEYNKELSIYQSTVQEAIENARLAQERILSQANTETSLSIQNELQTLAKQVQEYQATLEKYQADVNLYGAKVNAEVSAYSQNLNRFNINNSTLLQQYSLDIQNELNEYGKDLAVYQSTVQKALEDARLAQERILTEANSTTNLNLQNEAQSLVEQIQEYQATLQKYNEDLNKYQAEVNSQINEYVQNLQRVQINNSLVLQEYNLDIQNELNEFNEELSVYQSTTQKAFENARLAQERILTEANATTNLNLQNEAQELARQVQEYQAELQKHANEIQSYGVSVNENAAKFNSELQVKSGVFERYLALIATLREQFNLIMGAR